MAIIPVVTRRGIAGVITHLPRLAVGGAWFLVALTVLQLAWAIGAAPSGVVSLSAATSPAVDGAVIFQAPGLTYSGLPGAALALTQIMVIAGAAAATVFGRGGKRLAGHAILIAWSGLWLYGVWRSAALEPGLHTGARAGLMAMLTACTVVRAFRVPALRTRRAEALPVPQPKPDPADGAGEEELLTAADIVSDLAPGSAPVPGPGPDVVAWRSRPKAWAKRGVKAAADGGGRVGRVAVEGSRRAGRATKNGAQRAGRAAGGRVRPVVARVGGGVKRSRERFVRFLRDSAVLPPAKHTTS